MASSSGSSGLVFSFEQRDRSEKRGGQNQNQNQNQNRNQSESRKGNWSQSRVRPIKRDCWNCSQMGYMSSVCKAPKRTIDEKKAHIVQDAFILAMASDANSWVIDLGASFHTTANKEVLQNYVARKFGKVYLGDDEPCNIVGRGDVQIQTNGFKWYLKDVRYFLSQHFLSLSPLLSVSNLPISSFSLSVDRWRNRDRLDNQC
ncbi:hypothetical protein ACSBR1_039997 [Camellia fascicularis]